MRLGIAVVGLVLGVLAFVAGVATGNLWWYTAGVVLFGAGTAANVGLGRKRPRK
jgi:hypothetical protein